MNFRRLTMICLLLTLADCRPLVGTMTGKGAGDLDVSALQFGASGGLTESHPGLLLRIEYPGGITPAALQFLRNGTRALTNYPHTMSDAEMDERLYDQINKSAYFALRLYRHLINSGQFPANAIALDAVTIDGTPGGTCLTSITDAVRVPSVLTLRFFVDRHHDNDVSTQQVRVFMNSFGDWIAPRFALLTEPGAWPASAGMIAGTRGWWSGPMLMTCDPSTCDSGIADLGAAISESCSPNRRIATSPVAQLTSPLVRLPYPKALIPTAAPFVRCPENVLADPAESGTPCSYERFIELLVVNALTQVDPYLAMRMQWKRYIQAIDPALAARWPGGITTPAAQKRLQLIKRLMQVEKRYVADVSRRFADSIVAGPLGQHMREQRANEQAMADSMKATATSAWRSKMMTLLTLSATNVVATNITNNPTAGLELAKQALEASLQSAADTSSRLDALQSQFALSTAQSYSHLNGARFDITVDKERFTADNLAELRGKFLARYEAANIPEIPRQNLACDEWRLADIVYRGWTGDCVAGEPTGSGSSRGYDTTSDAYRFSREVTVDKTAYYTRGEILVDDKPAEIDTYAKNAALATLKPTYRFAGSFGVTDQLEYTCDHRGCTVYSEDEATKAWRPASDADATRARELYARWKESTRQLIAWPERAPIDNHATAESVEGAAAVRPQADEVAQPAPEPPFPVIASDFSVPSPTIDAIAAKAPVPSAATMVAPVQPSASPATQFALTLQVGAFRSQANAESLRERIAAEIPGGYVTESDVNGARIYRVRVGRFTSLPAAQDAKDVLRAAGYNCEILPLARGD